MVTGAASGIGRAVCLQLAREGVWVAGADVDERGLAETADSIGESGGRALALTADVAEGEAVRALARRVSEEWNRIDILVNCAGIFPHKRILELDQAQWDRVLAVHLTGTFLCCQAVLPAMMEQRSGRIVNTVSGLAVAGDAATAAYSAAKGGIISFTHVLATEAEPYGITVNAFSPGMTDTPMLRRAGADRLDQLRKDSPFGRLTTPEEAAEIAVWLTRPETSHLTNRILL